MVHGVSTHFNDPSNRSVARCLISAAACCWLAVFSDTRPRLRGCRTRSTTPCELIASMLQPHGHVERNHPPNTRAQGAGTHLELLWSGIGCDFSLRAGCDAGCMTQSTTRSQHEVWTGHGTTHLTEKTHRTAAKHASNTVCAPQQSIQNRHHMHGCPSRQARDQQTHTHLESACRHLQDHRQLHQTRRRCRRAYASWAQAMAWRPLRRDGRCVGDWISRSLARGDVNQHSPGGTALPLSCSTRGHRRVLTQARQWPENADIRHPKRRHFGGARQAKRRCNVVDAREQEVRRGWDPTPRCYPNFWAPRHNKPTLDTLEPAVWAHSPYTPRFRRLNQAEQDFKPPQRREAGQT